MGRASSSSALFASFALSRIATNVSDERGRPHRENED